ncbi:hypothetical protein SLEP1_g22340 [Rubroshorea leprosula]|uniref:Uncharacterized protein n=1 Tax=Rubroshorea leprosula TaxID=152421 RepID=A0AAV5JI55_9ROSI|nr:hypothetical protein SLEP1_g22340 [Rubroshorea leprosula]
MAPRSSTQLSNKSTPVATWKQHSNPKWSLLHDMSDSKEKRAWQTITEIFLALGVSAQRLSMLAFCHQR